ncbi:MAG TPA: hypothetical protein VGL81_16500 [Polyangiaceae bacterium]|jgi:hypothetical protein
MNAHKLATTVLLASAALLLPAAAAAQEEMAPPSTGPSGYMANRGLQFGARVGYSLGAGSVYQGLNVTDASNGQIPIQLDLGWRILPLLYVGAYGQFAPNFQKSNDMSCPNGLGCSAQDWRFGLEGDLHFLPRTRLDPYLGLSAGYEVLHTDESGTTTVPLPGGASASAPVGVSVTDRGWEFAALTLGFDARVDRAVGIGPYLQASINEFNVHTGTETVNVAGMQTSTPVPQVSPAAHTIFTAGLRGTFNP